MTVSVIGNVNVDLVLRDVDDLGQPGSERIIADAALRVAGAAGTTALALAHLGSTPRLYGVVGADILGSLVLAELAQGSLASDIVVRGRTGISVACESPRRDRSFLTFLGALSSFGCSDVPEVACSAERVIITGHFLLPLFRGGGSSALLGAARHHRAETFFDPGPEPDGWTPAGKKEILELLPLVDVFLPNEEEACALAGTDDPGAATRELAQRSGGWVVTKLGGRGAVAAHAGAGGTPVPAPRVRTVDTAGAGDSFNAGLLHGLETGRTMPDSLRVALATASLTISRSSDSRFPAPAEVAALASQIPG
ncbi:MAG: carbohydrate kinase family protein [Acidimicrobiales bacterium]|jgi:sugar/nucleoside kinase (ribokinase family)